MNIMAFRGSLGNYMAVMLLSFNGIFRFSIYPASLGGKSIKLFTFATICPGLSCIYTCGKAQKVECETRLKMPLSEGCSSVGQAGRESGENGLCETRSMQRAGTPGHYWE